MAAHSVCCDTSVCCTGAVSRNSGWRASCYPVFCMLILVSNAPLHWRGPLSSNAWSHATVETRQISPSLSVVRHFTRNVTRALFRTTSIWVSRVKQTQSNERIIIPRMHMHVMKRCNVYWRLVRYTSYKDLLWRIVNKRHDDMSKITWLDWRLLTFLRKMRLKCKL